MRDHLLAALDATLPTEIRFVEHRALSVVYRGRQLEHATNTREQGGTVRCLSPEGPPIQVGFQSLVQLPRAVRRARDLARELRRTGGTPRPAVTARVVHNVAPSVDDRLVDTVESLASRVAHLANHAYAKDRRLKDSRVHHGVRRSRQWVVTTEGIDLDQESDEQHFSVLALAEEGGVVGRSLRSHGAPTMLSNPDAELLVEQVVREALDRLEAVPLRPGRYPVVLDPRAAGLLIHRAVAHALGGEEGEITLPVGTRLGPEELTIADDGSAVGLRGTVDHDDEGTPGQNTTLVQHGVVVGRLHSRETAGAAGEGTAPTGNLRTARPLDGPILRLTNTYLANGQGSTEELLADISLGVYCEDAVGCQGGGGSLGLRIAAPRMIRGGRLAEPVRGAVIEGDLLPCLSKVEGVAGDFAWDHSASWCHGGGGGWLPVSTGAPHIRLLDIDLGLGSG